MKTEILKLNANRIERDKLAFAAEVLRNGGLVAFPTETVYGLGANALNESAVTGIFKAKGRPSDNPLIVHIGKAHDVDRLVSDLPLRATALMDAFWPGPLTLVMPRSGIIPAIITAGLETVAIRMPSHPIALALLEMSGVPVAAPSANTSGRPSPTRAEHVIEDLSGKVDVIIDGGSVAVGLESTVLDITSHPPAILRPGGITLEQLKTILPDVEIDPAILSKELKDSIVPRSPGMKYRHYAPKARITIIEGEPGRVAAEINRLAAAAEAGGLKTGILASDETAGRYASGRVFPLGSREHPEVIAARLFQVLRQLDELGMEAVFAEAFDGRGIGMAIMNRLSKAAGYNIIKV